MKVGDNVYFEIRNSKGELADKEAIVVDVCERPAAVKVRWLAVKKRDEHKRAWKPLSKIYLKPRHEPEAKPAKKKRKNHDAT